MAKLYFRYGAMGSSKTANAIMVQYNYRERGQNALMLKPQLEELKSDFDYEEYGGAPILGVNGPVIKIHGSSTASAVKNAIIKGIPYGSENVVEIIRKSMLDLEETIEKDEEA